MKKVLLLTVLLGFGMVSFAQQKQKVANIGTTEYITYQSSSNPYNSDLLSNNASSAAAPATPLSGAPNAYTCGFGPKTYVWTEPDLNTIIFSHRANNSATADLTVGALRYDFSTDGGATWTLAQGPVWNPADAGTDIFTVPGQARYPQAVLYNPTGNTDPNNAYFTFYAPTLNGYNDSWGGHLHGVQKLDGTGLQATETVSDTANGYNHLIPDDFKYVPATGKFYNVDFNSKHNATTDLFDYQQNVMLNIGTFNTTTNDVDYTSQLVPFMVDTAADGTLPASDVRISFAPNGLTGYMTMIAFDGDSAVGDQNMSPIFMKTLDGGNTWSPQTTINLATMTDLQNFLPFDTASGLNFVMTTGFEHDAVVDKNGNLHIMVAIGLRAGGPFTIASAQGNYAMVDLHTTDGGTTWEPEFLGHPMVFRGEFGTGTNTISEDNRGQTSCTKDGSQLFFSWFDTNTDIFGATDGNAFPDMFVKGYDVDADTYGPAQNRTVATLDEAQMLFANVTEFVLDNGDGTYTLPTTFMVLNSFTDVTTPVGFNYVGVTYPGSNIGVQENNIPNFNVSQNYPNPTSGLTSIDIYVDSPSKASVSFVNILGQTVLTENLGKLNQGKNTVELNVSSLNKGIYFYNVNVAGKVVSKKMIIE